MNIFDIVFSKNEKEIVELTKNFIRLHNSETGFGKTIRKGVHRNKYINNLKIFFVREGLSDEKAMANAFAYLKEYLYSYLK